MGVFARAASPAVPLPARRRPDGRPRLWRRLHAGLLRLQLRARGCSIAAGSTTAAAARTPPRGRELSRPCARSPTPAQGPREQCPAIGCSIKWKAGVTGAQAGPGMSAPLPADPRQRRPARPPEARAARRRAPLWFAEVAEHRRGAPAPAAAGRGTCRPAVAGAPRRRRARRSAASASTGRGSWASSTSPPTASPTAARISALAAAIARARALAADGRRHPRHRRRVRPGPAPSRCRPRRRSTRVVPVIAALRAEGFALPISIDTRNAAVARGRLRRRRRPLQRCLRARPRPGEPRARGGVGPAGLPDARAGRPEDDAGRAGLRRRAARRLRLPRGAGRRRRGGGHPARRGSWSTRASASARPWRTTSR